MVRQVDIGGRMKTFQFSEDNRTHKEKTVGCDVVGSRPTPKQQSALLTSALSLARVLDGQSPVLLLPLPSTFSTNLTPLLHSHIYLATLPDIFHVSPSYTISSWPYNHEW